jgi:hypothetical protein
VVTLVAVGWRPEPVSPAGPGSDTTLIIETTVTTGPSTTKPADTEAATRAQEEARRRAAEEAARQFQARLIPYLGLDLDGWQPVTAGSVRPGCGNVPAPLLGVRQVTYSAPETTGRHMIIEVISRYALCRPDEIPTTIDELGPAADPPAVIDHGMTTVLGHDARIVEEGGVYWVLWLLDDPGASARVIVFPGTTPLEVEEVTAIVQGVVVLSEEEWNALLAEEASDQDAGPMPQPFGPVSSSLLTIVARIPELSALQLEDVNDLIGDGINGAGGVSFRASDGGFVEIMVEQLSTPIPLEAFGVGTRSTTGPSGEDIVIRDIGHTLQVIAISNEGLMVNLLVERINRVDPTAESSLKSISEGQLLDWAVRILEEFSG